MKSRTVIVATTLVTTLALHAARAEKFGTVSDSTVTFVAVGPAGLRINGSTSGIRAIEKDGKMTLTVPTTTFETGIGLRDKHLRKYLESDKHPTADMVIDESKIPLPEGSAPVTGNITVPLTLHGTTAPALVHYELQRQGSVYVVHGDFEVNIHKFNIEKPCYLGVCVGDTVRIAAKFTIRGA